MSTMGRYLEYRGDIMSTVGYSNNKRFFHGTEHPHGTHDIPHVHHDIPHGTQDIPHGTHDIPHGTEHPPRYYTHIIQGVYWKDFAEASLSFTEPHKKNDNPNKNSQGKQTHS